MAENKTTTILIPVSQSFRDATLILCPIFLSIAFTFKMSNVNMLICVKNGRTGFLNFLDLLRFCLIVHFIMQVIKSIITLTYINLLVELNEWTHPKYRKVSLKKEAHLPPTMLCYDVFVF